MNYQFFNVFKGFTIFLCQIHLPLEKKSMFLHSKVSFSVIFFEFFMFKLKIWTIHYSLLFFFLKLHKLPYLNLFICFNNFLKKISFSCYSVLFFCLKLHKLPYLNLFICFNSILKKISFSCYIKWNTSHFNEKIFFFKKKDFSVFFPFISMFLMKMKEKARNILTFHSN